MWNGFLVLIFIIIENGNCALLKKTINFETKNNEPYQFTYMERENQNEDIVYLEIQTDKNAYICLSRQFPTCNLEVIIGKEETKIGFIKNNELTVHDVGMTLLDKNIFHSFWVKWCFTRNLEIKIGLKGKEGHETEIAGFNDTDPFAVNYIGFKSGTNSSARWQIKAFYKDVITEITVKSVTTVSTGDKNFLNFEPIIDNRITFEVKTESHACIALYRNLQMGDKVVIVIGDFDNTVNTIFTKPESVGTNSRELDSSKFKKFTIDIIKAADQNVIRVTRGDNSIVTVGNDCSEYWETSFQYYSLASDKGKTAYWQIKDYSTTDRKIQLFPIKNDLYRLKKPLRFKVKAKKDAYIALAGDSGAIEYQIMIGAWGNRRTIIRKKNDSDNDAFAWINGIVDKNMYKGFWIDWAFILESGRDKLPLQIDENHVHFKQSIFQINLGYENNAQPILEFQDRLANHNIITQFGVSCYENEVLWQFDDCEVKSYNNPNTNIMKMTSEYGLYDKIEYFETSRGQFFQYSLLGQTLDQHPTLQFKVKGQHALISLMHNSYYSDSRATILISNKTEIRFGDGIKKSVSTVGIINNQTFSKFWLTWNFEMLSIRVEFGLHGEDRPLLSLNSDKTFFKPEFYAVKSGDPKYPNNTDVTYWEVDVIHENIIENGVYEYDISPPYVSDSTNYSYIYKPIQLNTFLFEVQASSMVWVGLSGLSYKTNDLLEIVIGASDNGRSFIKKAGVEVSSWNSKELDPNKPKTFCVKQTYDKLKSENLVEVQRGDSSILMSFFEKRNNSYDFYVRLDTTVDITPQHTEWIMKAPARTYSKYYAAAKTDYQYFKIEGLPLQFKVNGSQGARVALSTEPYPKNGPDFEIYIGNNSNKNYVIFNKNNLTKQSIVQSDNILSADEERGFWINWYKINHDTGPILQVRLGHEGKPRPIVTYNYNGSLKLVYYGVARENDHVHFHFITTEIVTDIGKKKGQNIVFKNNTYTEFKTKKTEYRFFSALSKKFTFNVKSVAGAHIILSPAPNFANSLIEIFIGSDGNTKTYMVRSTDTRPELYRRVEALSSRILHGSQYRGFVVKWDEDLIRLSFYGMNSSLLSWHDLQIFPIDFVGVGTDSEFMAKWQLENTMEKLESGQISYFALSANSLSFVVKAKSDFKILLFSNPGKTDPDLEIVIGSNYNTKSYFAKGSVIKYVDTIDILNENEFRDFWIHFQYNSGNGMLVEVGQITQSKNLYGPFMSWFEENPYIVIYIGMTTTNIYGAEWGCSAIPASDTDWYKHNNCYVKTQQEDCSQTRIGYMPDDDDDDDMCDAAPIEINPRCVDMLPRNKHENTLHSLRRDIDSPRKLREFIQNLTKELLFT